MPNTTIEQLELEVQANASSAEKGIDTLSASLRKLKDSTKGGVGLNAVANQLGKINTALNGMSSENPEKLSKLSESLSKLKGLGEIKISSSISNQLSSLGNSVNNLNGVNFDGFKSLHEAMMPLTNLGKSNLGSFITQLSKIPEVTKKLDARTIADFSEKTKQLVNSLAPLSTQLVSISRIVDRLPERIDKVTISQNKISKAVEKTSINYTNLFSLVRMGFGAVRELVGFFGRSIKESNSYIESVNLFATSMGEYTAEAREFAENVGDKMGIDPGEFMRYQGVFMTITKGFGVASDQAYLMSQNLTQLGYDLGSLYNENFEASMQRIQSGIAGELEPLRRWGYDLSVARLQQEALNLGIKKSVNAMTQAEKAQLRYYAIMTQVTWAQGDMARTLNAPANQLRVLSAQVKQLSRAFGNILIPTLNNLLPYLIAVTKVLRLLMDLIGKFAGFEMPEVDYSNVNDGLGAITDNEDDATKAAKKLKNALSGIDELNILSQDSGSSDVGNIGLGGDLGIDLPEYDFMASLTEDRVTAIVDKMKDWLGITGDINSVADLLDTKFGSILSTATGIASAFAAWTISKKLTTRFGELVTIGKELKAIGFVLLLSDIKEFVEAISDIASNGADFSNVTKTISEFAGMLGDIALISGNVSLGGVLKTIQGVGEIVSSIKDMSDTEVNWDNVSDLIRGISNVAIGLGLLTGNTAVLGSALIIQGLTGAITELHKSMDAIREGRWSDIDFVQLAISAIEVIGGLLIALDVFGKLKGALNIGGATKALKDTTKTVTQMSSQLAPSSSFNTNLVSLAKNIGLGIVVLGEVALGAILFVGAIVVVGKELNAVGEAWSPVIENGKTIAEGIGLGTALLVGVGLATFLLGTATVSTAGTIPLAIAVGTAVLVELAAAFVLFTESLVAVADELNNRLHPALVPLNENLPTLETNMSNFVDYMTGFANEVVRYTKASAIAGLGATIDTIIGWFTSDPFKKLANDVEKTGNDTRVLNDKLLIANPELESAVNLLTDYKGFLTRLEALCNMNVELSTGMFINMEDVGKKLVTGFVSGIKSKSKDFVNTADTIVGDFTSKIESSMENSKTAFETWADNIVKWFTNKNYGDINENAFNAIGRDIVNGFNAGIRQNYSKTQSTVSDWGRNVKSWFGTYASYNAFYNVARDVVNGFNNGIGALYHTTISVIYQWAAEAVSAMKNAMDIHSPSRVFHDFGMYTVQGYNNGISDNAKSTRGIIQDWIDSFAGVNPTMSFAVDTSELKYYDGTSFARGINAEVTANSNITATGFIDGMEEFYREYVEPTMSQMASDMRRQADKEEQTVVQIGGRTITDVVEKQQKANGYKFATV